MARLILESVEIQSRGRCHHRAQLGVDNIVLAPTNGKRCRHSDDIGLGAKLQATLQRSSSAASEANVVGAKSVSLWRQRYEGSNFFGATNSVQAGCGNAATMLALNACALLIPAMSG